MVQDTESEEHLSSSVLSGWSVFGVDPQLAHPQLCVFNTVPVAICAVAIGTVVGKTVGATVDVVTGAAWTAEDKVRHCIGTQGKNCGCVKW